MMFSQTAPLPARFRVAIHEPATDPPVPGTLKVLEEVRMTFVPVMWTVWSAIVAVTAALYIYRSNLTRDEEDQLFLDESFDHEKMAQAAIVAKVTRVEPIIRVAQWCVIAMTTIVLAYYVRDILVHLNILGS
jgi:hypothetical protein